MTDFSNFGLPSFEAAQSVYLACGAGFMGGVIVATVFGAVSEFILMITGSRRPTIIVPSMPDRDERGRFLRSDAKRPVVRAGR